MTSVPQAGELWPARLAGRCARPPRLPRTLAGRIRYDHTWQSVGRIPLPHRLHPEPAPRRGVVPGIALPGGGDRPGLPDVAALRRGGLGQPLDHRAPPLRGLGAQLRHAGGVGALQGPARPRAHRHLRAHRRGAHLGADHPAAHGHGLGPSAQHHAAARLQPHLRLQGGRGHALHRPLGPGAALDAVPEHVHPGPHVQAPLDPRAAPHADSHLGGLRRDPAAGRLACPRHLPGVLHCAPVASGAERRAHQPHQVRVHRRKLLPVVLRGLAHELHPHLQRGPPDHARGPVHGDGLRLHEAQSRPEGVEAGLLEPARGQGQAEVVPAGRGRVRHRGAADDQPAARRVRVRGGQLRALRRDPELQHRGDSITRRVMPSSRRR